MQILKEKNITFDREKTFTECVSDTGNLLKFDFVLYRPNGEIYAIIEYNGIQHYQPIEFFGGQEGFESQIKRDNIKKEFCKNKQYQFHQFHIHESYVRVDLSGKDNGLCRNCLHLYSHACPCLRRNGKKNLLSSGQSSKVVLQYNTITDFCIPPPAFNLFFSGGNIHEESVNHFQQRS